MPPKVEAPRLSRQSAHEGGKVVSSTHQLPLPPVDTSGTHLCQRLSQPQGHIMAGRIMSREIPITPSGFEPATLQLVAQCLNQLHHCIHLSEHKINYKPWHENWRSEQNQSNAAVPEVSQGCTFGMRCASSRWGLSPTHVQENSIHNIKVPHVIISYRVQHTKCI